MTEKRLNPDSSLKEIRVETEGAVRGKLKVYLGMAAGVGKTYAMLSDALLERARGRDVVAGYIEPHGRLDTQRLAEKLPSIPVKDVLYHGVHVREFNLEEALRRAPNLLLVDELAHWNAGEAKHTKRWQDIEEILDHGIDVWTTTNIQHLESLTDIVTQITGVKIQETIPDSFFAKADEVELVDTPPENLIQRIRDGKVYLPDKIEYALQNFFNKGNLLALRELALRQTAASVEAEMDSFRTAHHVRDVWPIGGRILVCVGPNRLAGKVVRAGRRLANTAHVPMVVAYIESLRYSLLPPDERKLAFEALEFAEQLGAETIYRQSADIVSELLTLARERNAGLIVLGKPLRRRWKEFLFPAIVDQIINKSGNVDVHVVTGSEQEGIRLVSLAQSQGISLKGSLASASIIALVTAICYAAGGYLDLSDISMAYLAGVAVVSTLCTFWEAVFSAVLGVAAFDFTFVPPRYTFAVESGRYLLTFVVMLAISLLISRLTTRIKLQAKSISDRERRTASLFELTRRLTSVVSLAEIRAVCSEEFGKLFDLEVKLLTPDQHGSLADAPDGTRLEARELGVAKWAYDHKREAGASTDTLPGSAGLYIPLLSRGNCIGILGVLCRKPVDIEQRRLMEAFASQIALALERVHAEDESKRAGMAADKEKLRSSLLSSLSHDLRTPLAAISGAASGLLQEENIPPANKKELALTISEEADRLSRMVRNVLDITRLESGELRLQKEWHSLEELVGAALDRTRPVLRGREIKASFPPDFPLIQVDGLLVEQLFINLLENAAKHTPPKTQVLISAAVTGPTVLVQFEDNGPGVPAGIEEKIFEKHFTGAKAEGFGLGLFIAKGIALAHGGNIKARNLAQGGASFTLELPYSAPPPVEVADE